MAEAEGIHQQAQQRLAADLADAADRYAALDDRLHEEINARTTVESRLTAAELAADAAGRQHATELAALTARLEIVQGQHEAATSRNQALEQRLNESDAALEQARHDWRVEAATLTEQLHQRETAFAAFEADTIAARAAFENRLAEAEGLHQQSQQRLAADLAEAADRYAALEGRLREEINARTTIESRLARRRGRGP